MGPGARGQRGCKARRDVAPRARGLPPRSARLARSGDSRLARGAARLGRAIRGARSGQPDPDPHGRHLCHLASRRSEEHTSELQSHHDLVCRLLLEKKKKKKNKKMKTTIK